MSDTDSDIPNLIDRSVKRLFRDQPRAALRLAGIEAATVRFEDSNLNIPELRADHVFIVEEEGSQTPYALYLEYQLKPDPRVLASWGLKWLGLCHQLPMAVVLLVIYLEKGERVTFPSAYQRTGGRLQTTLTFDTVRLWEHRDRIVSGEWPELAPLLVLCEAHPTEQTLRQEMELIHNSGLPRDVQMDLLGVAVLVASRTFARAVLRTVFREEFMMIDALENLKELFLETGKLQMWVQDPRVSGALRDESKAEGRAEGRAEGQAEGRAEGQAEGRAEGQAEGRAEGQAEGRAEGEAAAARRMTLAFLTRRFGEVPEALEAQIATADANECQRLFDHSITATSLSELIETP